VRALVHLVASVLALALTAACTAVQPGCPREWLEVRGGVYDPRSRTGPEVDEGFGVSIGGGLDFNADPLRVSWEIAGAWAPHDVNVLPTDPDDDEVDLDVVRLSTGLRATLTLQNAPLGAYVHGGFAWRNEDSSDFAYTENDQWGTYVGAGLEWWYAPNATLGPAFCRFDGDEDDLEELWFGLVARFY
jgi:hypothetical protein